MNGYCVRLDVCSTAPAALHAEPPTCRTTIRCLETEFSVALLTYFLRRPCRVEGCTGKPYVFTPGLEFHQFFYAHMVMGGSTRTSTQTANRRRCVSRTSAVGLALAGTPGSPNCCIREVSSTEVIRCRATSGMSTYSSTRGAEHPGHRDRTIPVGSALSADSVGLLVPLCGTAQLKGW